MKKLILLLAGIAAAAGCVLITRSRSANSPRTVDDLAHTLQEAWADHHTVV